jgi:hypothetical protein
MNEDIAQAHRMGSPVDNNRLQPWHLSYLASIDHRHTSVHVLDDL